MPSVSRSQENTHVTSLCWGCAYGIPPVMPVDMRTPLTIHRSWARAHILMIAPAHRQTARSTRSSSISFSSTLFARQLRFNSLPLGSSYSNPKTSLSPSSPSTNLHLRLAHLPSRNADCVTGAYAPQIRLVCLRAHWVCLPRSMLELTTISFEGRSAIDTAIWTRLFSRACPCGPMGG